jgi:hypothetical protein
VGAFDYVITLESFVYALALAHLLSRASGLLLARDRVRFSGLQTLMMVNAVLTVLINWLAAWPSRGAKEWDLSTIAIWFACALTNFFLCAAAAPEVAPGERVDLDAFYWTQQRLFYGIYVLLAAVGVAGGLPLLKTSNPALFTQYTLSGLPFFAPPLLALLVKARWAHWLSGVGLFLILIGWAVLFTPPLR